MSKNFEAFQSFFNLFHSNDHRQLYIFPNESFPYKVWQDLHVNFKAIECLCIEFENKHLKIILLNIVYYLLPKP